MSVISFRGVDLRVVLRTEDSSCWYRKLRLRPLLGVCLGTDIDDTEACIV